ncbi:hypothetical protein RA210_U10369 [Rubrivivax sp. A210]|nr:hypothetical protein RA210_U10369 [Rubrivivax sp. A210]
MESSPHRAAIGRCALVSLGDRDLLRLLRWCCLARRLVPQPGPRGAGRAARTSVHIS